MMFIIYGHFLCSFYPTLVQKREAENESIFKKNQSRNNNVLCQQRWPPGPWNLHNPDFSVGRRYCKNSGADHVQHFFHTVLQLGLVGLNLVGYHYRSHLDDFRETRPNYRESYQMVLCHIDHLLAYQDAVTPAFGHDRAVFVIEQHVLDTNACVSPLSGHCVCRRHEEISPCNLQNPH